MKYKIIVMEQDSNYAKYFIELDTSKSDLSNTLILIGLLETIKEDEKSK